MENADYSIILDVTDMSAPISLNVKQGDAGRVIAVNLARDGVPVGIEPGSYAVFAGKKPDEKILWNSCSIRDSTIFYEITKQTTAVVGWVPVQIRLYRPGGKLVSSPDFVLIVDGTVTDDEEVIAVSENEVTALTELVSEAADAIEHALNVEGKSAYQVAQDAGFEGTVEEWLDSLIGPKGDKGDPGEKGDKGETGPQGDSVTITTRYAVSDQKDNPPNDWQDEIPEMTEEKPYLWIYVETCVSPGGALVSPPHTGVIGRYPEKGKDGSSTTITLKYGVSSTPSMNTVTGWQDTIPQMSETYPYLWIEISTETTTATGGSSTIEAGIIGYYSTPDSDGSGGGSDYVLPVGGEQLGGVKNGGNVVINADGTMTAPESSGGTVEVDTTLTKEGMAADAKAVGDALKEVGQPTDEQISGAVSDWLDEHPEATTTVADGTVTKAKIADELLEELGLEPNHHLTEVKIELSYCKYQGWDLQTGASGFRATHIFPTPQYIKIVSNTPAYGVTETINIYGRRFANSDDASTATFIQVGVNGNVMSSREGKFLKVPVPDGETVIIPTHEYGALGREYMQLNFQVSNFGKDMGLFDVYAIYDTWRPTYKLPEAGKIYEEDLPIKWVYRGDHTASASQILWGIAPYYPDFTYHIRGGNYYNVTVFSLDVAYLFDDTVFDGYISGLRGSDGSVPLLCGDGKETFATTQYDTSVSGGKDYNYAWAYHKTPPESELTGPKWIAFTMGSIAQSASTDMGEEYYNQLIQEKNDSGAQYLYISKWEDKDAPRRLLTTLVRKAEGFQDEGSIHDILVSGAENPMRNARWVIFGDSLADAYGGHDLTGNYFALRIAREFGLKLDNRAKGGSNIYAGGSGNYTSESGIVKLDEYLAEIEAGTTEQADYITVAFGTNAFKTDIGTNEDTSETYTASMYGATKYFIEKIREKVPNAVLGFVLSPKQQWPSSADPNGARDIDSARTAIKTVCDEYGVPYIDMSTQSGITVAMLPDGIHISNDQSQKLYYHAMRRFMMGL